jgi:hypothetical protein
MLLKEREKGEEMQKKNQAATGKEKTLELERESTRSDCLQKST